jgi:hypothetical protein
VAWSDAAHDVDRTDLVRALDATVTPIVEAFANTIGLWADGSQRADPNNAHGNLQRPEPATVKERPMPRAT